MYGMQGSTVGGWRGWLGVVAIALALGLAYASLAITVLSQWTNAAASPIGVITLVGAASISVLTWLLGAILR